MRVGVEIAHSQVCFSRAGRDVRQRTDMTIELTVGTAIAQKTAPPQSNHFALCASVMTTNDSSVAPPSLELRVLVVDDNVDGAQALSDLLTTMGCKTAVAYNGAQGIERAADFVPHLALIDLEMPDMSGCDVARHLRTGHVPSLARLVCLTGRGQPEDHCLCIDAGFDDFFTKPMLPENLMEMVAAANARLSQASTESTAGALPSPAAGNVNCLNIPAGVRSW